VSISPVTAIIYRYSNRLAGWDARPQGLNLAPGAKAAMVPAIRPGPSGSHVAAMSD